MNEELKIQENNEMIDHLVAAREIVRRKCSRCDGAMCMGCNLDRLAHDMLPDLIERAVQLVGMMPNDRREAVANARAAVNDRDEAWRRMNAEEHNDA